VIASFYGMKALKACGYEPKKTIRLILGLDEETNWHGMDHYLEHVAELPDLGFTPDGDFPAIHGEKGIIVFELVRKFKPFSGKGLELSSRRYSCQLGSGSQPGCRAGQCGRRIR